MKKILPLILVAVLMIFAVTQASAANYYNLSTANYFNGDYVEFWPDTLLNDGHGSHAIVTYASDGNAYLTVLTPDGWPSDLYYQMYLTWDGILYCSTDGDNWFICP